MSEVKPKLYDTEGQAMKLAREGEVRPKNQLTIPRDVARAAGIQPGDRVILEVREDHPREVRIRRLRESYAGALEGVYGKTPEEEQAYLEGERRAWEE